MLKIGVAYEAVVK